MATEIKSVYYHIWSVRLTSGTVLLSDLQAVFIYKNTIKIHWNVLTWHLGLSAPALPPAAGGMLCEALPSGTQAMRNTTGMMNSPFQLTTQVPSVTWLILTLYCYEQNYFSFHLVF